MPPSENDKIVEELVKSLESATTMIQSLLGDIKENSSSLTLVKAKLESLSSSVETLSHIVRDGNGEGSMMTRLVVLETLVDNIDGDFDALKKEVTEAVKELRKCIDEKNKSDEQKVITEKEYRRERLLAKLKVAAVVAPGVIALIIILAKALIGDDISVP